MTLGVEQAPLFQSEHNYGVTSINRSLCNAAANENAQSW